MPTLDLKLKLDITPKTSLTLPNDGKVIIGLKGSVDVPEPLLAQQIWDAAKAAVDKGKVKLQEAMVKAEAKGASPDKIQKYIDKTFDYIQERANKAVDETIDAYMKMNSTYTLVKRQDVSMVAKSGTAVVLSVVRLVITAGADLSAWQSLGSTLYDSAKYLYKALVKIEEVDNKTKESVRDADKYYREKVMKGKESFFEKFKKFFSDPLTNASTDVEDMQKRLARAEAPCHKMAATIQKLLELQDEGNVDPKVEKKLNLLLISVSDTMSNVTPANASLKKQQKILTLLQKDLKQIKSKSKKDLEIDDKQKDSLADNAKKLKKAADDNGVNNWYEAAKNTVDLAKELSKLL